MSTPHRNAPTDRERRLDALLQTAAEYEPESPMPHGLEARALARRTTKPGRFPFLHPGLALSSGLALAACFVVLCIAASYRRQPKNVPRADAVIVARFSRPNARTSIGRANGTQSARSSPLLIASKNIIVHEGAEAVHHVRKRLASTADTVQLSQNTALSGHAAIPHLKGIERNTEEHFSSPHPVYPARSVFASRKRSRGAVPTPMWRTEIVETESVYFAAPALITSENTEQHTITIAPAYISYPVHESDVFCAVHKTPPNEDSGKPGPDIKE